MKKKKTTKKNEKKPQKEQKENQQQQLMADDSRGFALWGSFDRTTKEWNNNMRKGFSTYRCSSFLAFFFSSSAGLL